MAEYAKYAAAIINEGEEPLSPEAYAQSIYADLSEARKEWTAECAERNAVRKIEVAARDWWLNAPAYIAINGQPIAIKTGDLEHLERLFSYHEDECPSDALGRILEKCASIGLITIHKPSDV